MGCKSGFFFFLYPGSLACEAVPCFYINQNFTIKKNHPLNEKFEKSDFSIFRFFSVFRVWLWDLEWCFDGYIDGGEGKVVCWGLIGLALIEGGGFWVRVVGG